MPDRIRGEDRGHRTNGLELVCLLSGSLIRWEFLNLDAVSLLRAKLKLLGIALWRVAGIPILPTNPSLALEAAMGVLGLLKCTALLLLQTSPANSLVHIARSSFRCDSRIWESSHLEKGMRLLTLVQESRPSPSSQPQHVHRSRCTRTLSL